MKDRFTTLGGGLAALLLVVLLLLPTPSGEHGGGSRPTTEDAGDYGLSGVWTWLRQGGIPVVSLRGRYDRLSKLPGLPPRGNLLVVVLPQAAPARFLESLALEAWVWAGNSVLLLIAAGETPEWAAGLADEDGEWPMAVLGLERVAADAEGGPDGGTPRGEPPPVEQTQAEDPSPDQGQETTELFPAAAIGLLSGVRRVLVEASGTDAPSIRTIDRSSLALVLLRDGQGRAAMWQLAVPGTVHMDGPTGKVEIEDAGWIWVLRFSDLLTNRRLGEGDNGRLFTNVITVALGSGPGAEGHAPAVIFDDMHQGLSDLYDPEVFFSDPRLHRSLWFLFGFWLLYLIGHSRRLAPLREPTRVVHGTALARAFGGLLARRVSRRQVGRELLRHFCRELTGGWSRSAAGGRTPACERLQPTMALSAQALARLRALENKPGEWSRRDLTGLLDLMYTIRKHRHDNPG